MYHMFCCMSNLIIPYPLCRCRDMGWMGLESLPAGLFDDVPKLENL